MKKLTLAAAIGCAVVMLSGCDVEQTEEGELPEVEIEAEEGNMPEYDVDTADVEVTTEERTVEVPEVEIDPADADTE